MALPAAADFTGSSITEAQFKSAITDLRDYIAALETVAPGIIAHFPAASAPTGWLKANGAAISRSTYSALFAAIGVTFGTGDGSTTFNVPDLRGEFLRGLDDSRGVDTGRTLSATAQAGQNLSHSHTGSAASNGAHTHNVTVHDQAEGATATITRMAGAKSTTTISNAAQSSGSHTHTLSIATDGGTEARPRNIALLACIKY